ncbi:MAG: hypothetical protein RJA34_3044 [Pseudomonadota bacterium]
MDITQHPRWERQQELEREMRGIGFSRVESGTRKATASGSFDASPAGSRLVSWIIEPLSKMVAEFCDDVNSGKPGRRRTAGVYLSRIHPDAAAYLIAKVVINTKASAETHTAVMIGRAIEEECRFQFYHSANPALYDTIMRDHKKRRMSTGKSVSVMKGQMNKAGVEWPAWPEKHCMQIGMQGIEWLLALDVNGAGPLIQREEQVRASSSRRRTWRPGFRLTLTAAVEELIGELNDKCAVLTPGYLPCVVPPKPWTRPTGGGYYSDMLLPVNLVKTGDDKHQHLLNTVTMPDVYEAVNIVQATAWKINTRVLDVMREAWEGGMAIGTLPRFENDEIPPKPPTPPPCKYGEPGYKEWQATPDGKRWRAWRRMAAAVHEQNIKNKSRRLQAAQALHIADMYQHEAEIYFPHNLDFRSRLYCLPSLLTPQGPDYARGLLTFAHGEPLTDNEAVNWLAIHGANCYGIDKVSYEERIGWVREHKARILNAAVHPFDDLWWTEAENPWQFLAFCFEWLGYMTEGRTYRSSLPVSLDGTCNGLQHFSAMLRDPIGGKAVNLRPVDRPADIYQTVADQVRQYLTVDDAMPSTHELADQWIQFGVTRKLTKRPVMILPYGGTQYACRKYVEEFVREQITEKHKPNPFGDDIMPAVIYLTKLIWQAIEQTAVAATRAMRWLRAVSSMLVKAGHAVEWITPAGFPARQAYVDMEGYRVRLMVGDKKVYKWLRRPTTTLDADQQVNGLPPNFVHSLDASALMASAIASHRRGVRSFAMVHDSYGTLAAHTRVLDYTLRRAFADMYLRHDVLADMAFYAQTTLGSEVRLPQLPPKGDLDIEEVMASRFFFA